MATRTRSRGGSRSRSNEGSEIEMECKPVRTGGRSHGRSEGRSQSKSNGRGHGRSESRSASSSRSGNSSSSRGASHGRGSSRSESKSSSNRGGGRSGGAAQRTTDHEQIRQWVEERGGSPACVRGTGNRRDTGLLRIDMPGYTGEDKLAHIDWDQWFEKFEEKNLAFLYQDKTKGGRRSNFNKLVER